LGQVFPAQQHTGQADPAFDAPPLRLSAHAIPIESATTTANAIPSFRIAGPSASPTPIRLAHFF
jgi:hypothetical protein